MGICKSLCHSFNFVNMRFVVKTYFSLLSSTRRVTFMESLLQNFAISLIKQESYSSPHCIFQRVYALNTRSIKIPRRSVVKVLIMLLINI